MPIRNLAKKKSIATIRAHTLCAAREWFSSNGFTEVQGPLIIPAIGKQPCSFSVQYFDRKAYLSHGLQPYADTFLGMFHQIYTITPVFRAEKVTTNRHLAEYWHIEAAASNFDLHRIMTVQEQLLESICNHLCREAKAELEILERDFSSLERTKAPLPKITYDKAIEMLQNEGEDIQWGAEITWQPERKLSIRNRQPFFIIDYPISQENLFFETNPQKPEMSLAADLFAPEGYGEIASCGEMAKKKSSFVKRLREEKLEADAIEWFSKLKGSTSKPSAGFAMGIERAMQWFCGLQRIEETVVFPRNYKRAYP